MCPDVTYKLTDTSNNPITLPYMTLTANKITISTSLRADMGSYTYKIIG